MNPGIAVQPVENASLGICSEWIGVKLELMTFSTRKTCLSTLPCTPGLGDFQSRRKFRNTQKVPLFIYWREQQAALFRKSGLSKKLREGIWDGDQNEPAAAFSSCAPRYCREIMPQCPLSEGLRWCSTSNDNSQLTPRFDQVSAKCRKITCKASIPDVSRCCVGFNLKKISKPQSVFIKKKSSGDRAWVKAEKWEASMHAEAYRSMPKLEERFRQFQFSRMHVKLRESRNVGQVGTSLAIYYHMCPNCRWQGCRQSK